jgi:arabinofuranosyltransferase
MSTLRTRVVAIALPWLRHNGLLVTALVLFALALVRTAWMNDDAYITLRTVDNFLSGHGLRWNVSERVQAYTHPLWLMVLTPIIALTGEYYFTTLAVSAALALAAVLVLVRSATSSVAAALGVLLLLASRAFVDYSTSGLENCLLFLLWAVAVRVFTGASPGPSQLRRLSLVVALAMLTRMDAVLLFGPLLAASLWSWLRGSAARAWLSAGGAMALGFTPLFLWELFSFFYYGFLFPNTAYAKLGHGVSSWELARHGLSYFRDSQQRDPVTLASIALGLLAALVLRRRDQLAIAAGIGLHLLYVVRIGGDFMSGRFFAAPCLASVTILMRQAVPVHRPRLVAGLVALAGLASFAAPAPSLTSGCSFGAENRHKIINRYNIADERAFYYRGTGLLRCTFDPEPRNAWADYGRSLRASRDRSVVVHENIGFIGFYGGPETVILDEVALSDPLLARLPARFRHDWRIGHFRRAIPAGYTETLATGRVQIEEPRLAAYYRALQFVTRGPLFSWDRLRTAVAFNLGAYDALVDREQHRFARLRRASLLPAPGGVLYQVTGKARWLPLEGMVLHASRPIRVGRITVERSQGVLGRLVLLRRGRPVWSLWDPVLPQSGVYAVPVPAIEADALWVVPDTDEAGPVILRRVQLADAAGRG